MNQVRGRFATARFNVPVSCVFSFLFARVLVEGPARGVTDQVRAREWWCGSFGAKQPLFRGHETTATLAPIAHAPDKGLNMDVLIPPAVSEIFANPPLVRGEDEAAYQRMVGQLGAESGAATAFDWLQVKDVDRCRSQ